MGVPKFFRYISERYPCLTEKLKEYQIPEFDNLYLDMNGIIHNCSHPNDSDVSFRITEEEIFKNIFHYIEILFRIIQPQKLFFMAVDGVAPRAKINQQRGRRFRSAKEAEVQEAKARAKGQEIPAEVRFDSNCITPGTVFMTKLNEQLKYFITYKVSTDRLWQKCKIILSGSEVPGEGEHKIMDYIRYIKAQPNYEGNTRHCLYGLDADLIMLGLCSHEPHFSLLREEVKFGKTQKKILTPEETNFCLLHLSLMREYLEHEFSPVKDKLSFEFDIEKIIDDWILMGFLVGNDFIPHLPNIHIEHDALPLLYNAYMEILPTLDGYVNEAGILNLERFEKFMEKLGKYDMDQFDEIYADLKYFEAKTGRRLNVSERNSKSSPDENGTPKKTMNKALNKALNDLIIATETELGDYDEDEADEDTDDDIDIQMEFVQHKRDYYMNKMQYENIDAEIMRSQAEGYIRAIQWNLHYYYNGCCSWSWYYPHHYAPYISDIKNFKDLKLEFDMGKPFLPFEQLLAVLPAASKSLLPEAYRGLMTEENSPIINYYPLEFKTDLNGKRQEWEAVVLIPLIDEKSLLSAMEPCNAKLTPDEIKRNKHGPMSIFTYTSEDQGIYEAPEYFPAIRSHAQVQLINAEDILIPLNKLVKGLCKGVQLDVYYPGFPTLKHIPHTACLEKAKVKVFEQPSKRENMILTVLQQKTNDLDIDNICQSLLGKTVFLNWPHLIEGLVVGVSNSKKKINTNSQMKQSPDGNVNFNIETLNDVALNTFNNQRKTIMENYKNRLGIEVGNIDVLVYIRPIIGRQYVYTSQGKMTLEKQWCDIPIPIAYQVVLRDITVYNKDFICFTSIQDVFKPKSVCFMLGHPHYGAMGEVTEPGVDLKTSRVKVAMRVTLEPTFDKVKRLHMETRQKYMPGNVAAQRLGVSSHLFSRITGTIFVISGEESDSSKRNVGLNLKFNKKNEGVLGYTRKDNNGSWCYSTKAVDLVNSYFEKFPDLFERLEVNLLSNPIFMKSDLFPDKTPDALEEVVSWLKEHQKSLGTTTRGCNDEDLEPEIVQCIEKEVDGFLETQRENEKIVLMQVKPHLLYKPGLNSGSIPPDAKAQYRLLDRIINVRECFTVPLGYKGTIIGIQKNENLMLNMYEVLFDKAFAGGLTIHECSPNRAYRLAATDMINITYGIQIENRSVMKVNQPILSRKQSHQQTPSPKHIRNTPEYPTSRQQKLPPQYQQPDRLALNNLYPFGKTEQNNKRILDHPQVSERIQTNKSTFNESPKHRKMPERTQFPTAPVVLQRQQNPSDKNVQPIQSQGPSEFQALWNELNKIQKPMVLQTKQEVPPSKESKPNPLPTAIKDTPQDPSAILKAMLKISDENTQSDKPSSSSTAPPPTNKPLAFTQTAKTTDTPPLVQQLFDHARQAEMKSDKSNIWYGSQLLSHYQLLGTGFPRYIYCTNKENLVCAQIILPDSRTFCGDFCRTHNEAAENTAKKVYEELKLDKRSSTNMPQNVLRPPVQQWFNNRNVRQFVPPPPKPILPPAFPQVPLMQIPMPKWSPLVQSNAGHGNFPGAPMRVPPPQLVPQHAPQNVPQPRFPQQPLPNRQEPTPKKSTPFVPLQVQKKTRNTGNTKQDKREQRLQKEKDAASNRSEHAPKENVTKETKQEKSNSNKYNESDTQNNQPQNAQKSQKTVKQRRSRVAAKFQSDPMANGSDRQ